MKQDKSLGAVHTHTHTQVILNNKRRIGGEL